MNADQSKQAQIGLIGLAVMGQNLALNIAGHGFPIAVYNRTAERTREFVEQSVRDEPVTPAYTIDDLLAGLERPRRVILMVQAGPAVDAVLAQLRPRLEPGDVVVDGGNSRFHDTVRRGLELAPAGIHFFGAGISGGEEGALKGPSIMPGGPRQAYERWLAPVFETIAAQVDDGPCVTYIGPGGSGHFVKMVHNGIEYGDMQLIAEVYDLLRRGLALQPADLSEVFARWNEGELNSYLIEITSHVLAYADPETGTPLVDVILDRAGQKGTGRWTSQEALELAVPIPTIDAAVWARTMSAFKEARLRAAAVLRGPAPEALPHSAGPADRDGFIAAAQDALFAAKIVAYAQGMALLRAASEEYGWGLDLSEIARIWKGGCIIRARLLDQIRAAFRGNPVLPNLLLDPAFAGAVTGRQPRWREVVGTARTWGVPCPALNASLDYFDSYRQARLPANLIQAQRDYFGAHTYERVDRPGVFHTHWPEEEASPAR